MICLVSKEKNLLIDSNGDNPLDDESNRPGDLIVTLLDDEKLLLAFSIATEKKRQSPQKLLKTIVKKWLKENGFMS